MTSVGAVLYFPDHITGGGSTPAYLALLLDASGEQAGAVVQAPKTGAVRKIHWRTMAVTTPTDTDVRLETVSASTGKPSGSLFGTNTNGTQISGNITANTWMTTTLTADASVTVGDMLAIVIAPTGSPNFEVARLSSSIVIGQQLTYTILKSGGTWGSVSGNAAPVVALEYSDGSFAYMLATPFSAISATVTSSTSTPDEIAMKFTAPFACSVNGFRALLNIAGSTSITAVLYDSNSSVLSSITIDTDQTAQGAPLDLTGLFTSPTTLTRGEVYYLALKPGTSTSHTIYAFSVASVAILDQMSGGQAFHYAERTDAGAWSATTTKRPLFSLLISSIDDGTGSGSGSGSNIPSIGGA